MSPWPFDDDQLRAMYRGGRGDRTARRFAHLWAAVFSLGLFPRRWVTLQVVGRRSGKVTKFPLGMARFDNEWYLVSMLGDDCNWVQNVRAANGEVVLRRRRARACRLVEVPAAQRPQILKCYVEQVPGGRPHIPVDHRAPAEAFAEIAPRYPTFRVDMPA
jgi:deazaflavin-dependent oxidoreductase (nitroreductase family)